MGDVYATITEAEEAIQHRLADVLELRAADPQQQAMTVSYLRDLPLPAGARVLEIGCGTGAVTRVLAGEPRVGEVIGIDPSPVFVERARRLAGEARELHGKLSFMVGDGRDLPFGEARFDAVVCHTTLCHIPGPERVLAEAARVVAGDGHLAVFEGDYATTTVATCATDPLQACADAAIAALVHDPFLVRRLPGLVRQAGWMPLRVRSHGYVEAEQPSYMLTLVDRGADSLVATGRLGKATADALKEEARRRVADGEFFGHIAYASLIARLRATLT